MQITITNTEQEATMELKTAWQFYCVNGACGTMVMPYACSAEEALRECRLSLGVKVMKVF